MLAMAVLESGDDGYKIVVPMPEIESPWTAPRNEFATAIAIVSFCAISLAMNGNTIYACAVGLWDLLRIVAPYYMVSQLIQLAAPIRYIVVKAKEGGLEALKNLHAYLAVASICIRIVTISIAFTAWWQLASS
ncbi:uncharacterized protein LOC126284253 isoform X2 [Schistocerca gregaria]|uniref:uncharacterized protein LOC126284253 isoform X2 n=1 Tax=Schistocerca gregaria TaxID=7010 RepID=UPI00211E7356|nr:uncharacterized protein LOC126284253 isoform X2 [Schistocerca gregaria]